MNPIAPIADQRSLSRMAIALWLLMFLFFLRVIGQILVEFCNVQCLPISEEWFSGLMPYPQLLVSQFLILALMTKIGWDFSRRVGWTYKPRRWAGSLLLSFGGLYLAVMIIRYAIRMSLYPHERWTGGSIPIFFHWVLALYVIVVGVHQRSHGPASKPGGWLRRCTWGISWTLVLVGIAAWVLYLLAPTILAWQLDIRPPEFAVRAERSVAFTTSDGISLVADIYHPRRAGATTPTILVRIPYSKTFKIRLFATVIARMWAEHGYTVVFQGTRGRFESGGQYYPLRDERQDGIDTLKWLKQQPWFDGRLGMWGCSYYGYTQWVLADQSDPGPTALLIQEASTHFHDMFYPGGAFSLKSALHWALMSDGPTDKPPTHETLKQGFDGFPLKDADLRAGQRVQFFQDWLAHSERDDYWRMIDGDNRPATLQAPTLLMGGWFDPFLPGQLRDYTRIRRDAKPQVAAATRLVIGPWAHAETVDFPDGTQPRNFRLECLAPSVGWFDQHLRGMATPNSAPVRLYVMGLHQWRDEQEWPLARTRYTPYYLHSDGHANSSKGDGVLTTQLAMQDARDTFTYDPRKPVSTAGGAMLGFDAGIAKQNDIEQRDDVLVYTTVPFTEDMEVTGPVQLVLHVNTTATSTDFTAKLCDVHPDGSTFNVCDGILRRSHTPDQVQEVTIDLWPTCMVFRAGHRLRLQVSSSNFPRYDRNPNTGRPIAGETAPITAKQSIIHGPHLPSRLILPVIPK